MITSYKSSTVKRLYTNSPFKSGMFYEDITIYEGRCKTIFNLDSSNSGDCVFPRPPFINSILHDGVSALEIKENTIIQKTNLGKDFLINFQYTVDEDTYITEDTITRTDTILNTYGIKITELENDLVDFESNHGTKEVILVSVVEGNLITVKDTADGDTYSVRLLGVGEDDGSVTEPHDKLVALIGTDTEVYLVHEPLRANHVSGETFYAYVFTKTEHYFLNQQQLWAGTGPLVEVTDQCLFYDTLLEANEAAISGSFGLYADPTYDSFPTAAEVRIAVATAGSTAETDLYLDWETIAATTGFYFKKSANSNPSIDTDFYDTVGFKSADLEATNIINHDVTPLADTYIEILKMVHTNSEYAHTVSLVEMPHVNHVWKNAISFLGRVIQQGVVAYKGLITVQYNNTDFKFILIKAEEVEPLAWNSEDVYSMFFNAFDDDPYVYEDHIGDDTSSYFTYPVIGTVLIYDKDPLLNDSVKVLNGFSAYQDCYIKPYLTFPTIPTDDLIGCFIAYKWDPTMEDDDLDWYKYDTAGLLVNEWVEITKAEYDAQPVANQNILGTISSLPAIGGYTTLKVISFELTGMGLGIQYAVCLDSFNVVVRTLNAIQNDFSNLGGRALEIMLKTIYIDPTELINYEVTNIDKLTNTTAHVGTFEVTVHTSTNVVLPVDTTNELHYTIDVSYAASAGTLNYTITNLVTGTTATSTCSYVINATGTDYFNIIFEGLNFKTNIEALSTWSPITFTGLLVDITFTKNEYTSTVPTQIIYLRSVQYVDQNDMLDTHNVWNATHIAQFDRFIILYGDHMGNHSIQFLEYDNFGLAPFPYYQIEFSSTVKHIHNHRGSLYVFTSYGIYILHDGLLPTQLVQTFAYAGINLDFSEKDTVVSLGNNVFVLSNNRGYEIRANQNVEDQSDVYTVVLTAPVDTIIESPFVVLKDRLEYGYGVLLEGASDVTTEYKCFVINNDLYLIASYDLSTNGTVVLNKKIMFMYIYNKDNQTWKIYDMMAATHPIGFIDSNRIRGVDFICKNNRDNGCITVASFIYSIPNNDFTENTISDVSSLVLDSAGEYHFEDNNVKAVACAFDTGALGFNQMHRKRVRRILLDITNVDGEALTFNLIPYIDGIAYANRMSVSALINMYEDMGIEVSLNPTVSEIQLVSVVSPVADTVEAFTIDANLFTTYSKLRISLQTNLHGNIPGFKLNIQAIHSFKILSYGIVYRQQRAR